MDSLDPFQWDTPVTKDFASPEFQIWLSELVEWSENVHALTRAQGANTSDDYGNTETAIEWASPTLSEAPVTVSGTEITINETGVYKFTVTLRTDNNNRTELFVRTYVNTVEQTASVASNYIARDTDQNTGAVTLTDALSLEEGDVVEFRGEGDCDGTCTGLAGGTILLIERV